MGDSFAFDKDRRCFGAKSTVCLSENSLSAWPTPKGSPIALIGGDNVHHQLTIPIVVPHLAEVIDVQIVSPKFALVSDVVEAACFAIGIQETWFFGLTASAEDGTDSLLPKERKFIDLVGSGRETLKLSTHFFPEKNGEIIQTSSIDFVYSDVTKQITTGRIKLPVNLVHDLAALSLAVLFPFRDGLKHLKSVKQNVLPQAYSDDENTTAKIAELYNGLLGKSSLELKRTYLSRAESLAAYGRSFFSVSSKQADKLKLSVCSAGVALYRLTGVGNISSAVVDLAWSNIKSISYKDCKLTLLLQPGIEGDLVYLLQKSNRLSNRSASSSGSKKSKVPRDSSEPPIPCGNSSNQLVVWAPKRSDVRQIMYVFSGNHELYLRSRRLQSVELKVLKRIEERNAALLQSVFERYGEAMEQVASLKSDIRLLSEEKAELQKRQEVSFAALQRVQTAAQLIEANSSVCIEENNLLRAKCAELEARVQMREHVRSRSAAPARSFHSEPAAANAVFHTAYSNFQALQNQSAEQNHHHPFLADENQNLYLANTERVQAEHSAIGNEFSKRSVSDQKANAGPLDSNAEYFQRLANQKKSASEQELRPTVSLAAAFEPQNSFNLNRPPRSGFGRIIANGTSDIMAQSRGRSYMVQINDHPQHRSDAARFSPWARVRGGGSYQQQRSEMGGNNDNSPQSLDSSMEMDGGTRGGVASYQNMYPSGSQLSSSLTTAGLSTSIAAVRGHTSSSVRPILPDRFGHVRQVARRDGSASMNRVAGNSRRVAQAWINHGSKRLSGSLDRLISREDSSIPHKSDTTNRSNSAYNVSTRANFVS